jgi:hypothetical protein
VAKKTKAKTKTSAKVVDEKSENQSIGDVPGLKQTAGAVTGAVLGGVVGGPVGALAGGALGAMVGDSSAKGKKPIKRAVDAIREEITSGRAKEKLKSVGERIRSLRPGGKEDAATKMIAAKKTDKKPAAGKKNKKAAAATGAKSKNAKKKTKGESAKGKKGAKKKR